MSDPRHGYGVALRSTLRTTAAAYGYTLSTATTISMLTTFEGKPSTAELFLFAVGGLAAFALLEAIVALLHTAEEDRTQHAFPFAGALNVVAVAGALGSASAIAHAVHAEIAWLLAPMAATGLYMMLVALQVAAVSAWRRRR